LFRRMERVVQRIVRHLQSNGYFQLPYKCHSSEDGTTLPVKVVFWMTSEDKCERCERCERCECCEFGITVMTRGFVEHCLFNVTKKNAVVDEAFVREQLERVKRIMARPVRALSGSLGPHKTDLMEALGTDAKAFGIDACCVCAKETTIKTSPCKHPLCISCFVRVESCPLCRNGNLTCECCPESEGDFDSDDEFDNA